jgi:hypothetical protein
MVWPGISRDGHTQFKIVDGTLNAVRYRDNILDPIVPYFLQQRNFDHVFHHDNARCHVAGTLSRISEPESHPCSSLACIIPDMSPIEHLLDELSRRVRRRQNSPEALQELRDLLVHQ